MPISTQTHSYPCILKHKSLNILFIHHHHLYHIFTPSIPNKGTPAFTSVLSNKETFTLSHTDFLLRNLAWTFADDCLTPCFWKVNLPAVTHLYYLLRLEYFSDIPRTSGRTPDVQLRVIDATLCIIGHLAPNLGECPDVFLFCYNSNISLISCRRPVRLRTSDSAQWPRRFCIIGQLVYNGGVSCRRRAVPSSVTWSRML